MFRTRHKRRRRKSKKRRQLKMAITWRGSIALRGNLSSRKGRARRVDLQCPGDFFRARCPPGCLPPTPKLKLSVVGGQPGGAPGGQGRCPWTPRSALHDDHKNWRGRWPPTLPSRKLSEVSAPSRVRRQSVDFAKSGGSSFSGRFSHIIDAILA